MTMFPLKWVTALDYEARTGKVVAATENSVLIIDANVSSPQELSVEVTK